MKLFKALILLLAATACLAAKPDICYNDYECGDMPYAKCSNDPQCNFNINGITINSAGLTYGKFCGEENEKIKRAPITNGLAVNLYTNVRKSIIQRINKIHSSTADGEYVYFSIDTSNGNPPEPRRVNALKVSTGEVFSKPVYSTQYVERTVDVVGDTTYAIGHLTNAPGMPNYSIYKFTGILGFGASERIQIHELGYVTCDHMRVSGDYVWYVCNNAEVTASNVWKASIDGSVAPSIQYTIPFRRDYINDFDVVGETFYYALSAFSANTLTGGVFAVNSGVQSTIYTGTARGVKVYNNIVYYSTVDKFYAAPIGGFIQYNVANWGTCGCAYGFIGDDCKNCTSDRRIQWNDDNVECVAVQENGFPEKCHNGWDCQYEPFTQCNFGGFYDSERAVGNCGCLPGFTGAPTCDRCADSTQTVQWNDDSHVPYCQ